MEFTIEIYLSLRFNDIIESKTRSLIKEIEELSQYLEFKVFQNRVYNHITIKHLKSPPKKNKRLDVLFDFDDNFIFLMKFRSDGLFVKHNDDFLDVTDVLLRSHIEKRVSDLIVVLAIAKKGIIECTGGQIYINRKFISKMPILIHSINSAIKITEKYKWPVIRNMPIKQVWLWYSSFSQETDGLSFSRIGRALNAYSQLFSTQGGEDEQAELFWTLLGIEAIYVQDKENILQQVNENSELFLGKRIEFKKAFKELYDYRSRFVHGDLNINNKFLLKDGTTEFLDGIYKFYEKQGYAGAILLATFQKLIRLNKREIEFKRITKIIIG